MNAYAKCVAIAAMVCQMSGATTPAEYLKTLPRPVFKEGHGLLPLSRFGWTLPFDARVELAENWGYCLEFGGYVTEKSIEKLADSESIESKLCALTASDPKRYPMFVICSRRLPFEEAPAETWARDVDGKLLDAKAESMDGTEWQKGMKVVWSPEAPDSVWEMAGAYRADPIREVRKRCPIAIVLNGGEYGLGVIGFAEKVWEKDPRIVAAKGEKPWFDYISERKAHQELIIANAVRDAAPDRQLYIYYPTSGGTHRNRWGGWKAWCYGYEWMKPVSDLASSESYYSHFNTGWTGKQDMLTMALNARGFEIAQGQPLSYNWLCAGWPRGDKGDRGLGDLTRYTGFLKCYYTTGMVGGNAGYYAYPKGGFGIEFESDAPPHWLRQMVAFSRVHALFSHLEPFLREGDLLPGPHMHVWSKDQPAYEFPTGDDTVRVVARKRRDKPEWLVTAWAAGGDARDVSVTLTELGEITLRARPAGSVCRAVIADGKPELELVDLDADGSPAD